VQGEFCGASGHPGFNNQSTVENDPIREERLAMFSALTLA